MLFNLKVGSNLAPLKPTCKPGLLNMTYVIELKLFRYYIATIQILLYLSLAVITKGLKLVGIGLINLRYLS